MSGRKIHDRQPFIDRFLAGIENGDTHRAAAAAADIDRVTIFRWMKDDATLRNQVEKAEGIAEHRRLQPIIKAAEDGNWQASAWWLERRRSEDYARRERVDMTLDVSGEARKLAASLGLDEATVLAEAEAILSR